MKEIKYYSISKHFPLSRKYVSDFRTIITNRPGVCEIDCGHHSEWHENPKFSTLKEAEKYSEKLISHYKEEEFVKFYSNDFKNDEYYHELFNNECDDAFYILVTEEKKEEIKDIDILEAICNHEISIFCYIVKETIQIFQHGDTDKLLLDKLP